MNIARSQVKRSKELKVSKLSAPLSCIVTGFDAFEGQPFNPSQIIAESMPDWLSLTRSKVKIPITSFVLPTSGEQAWKRTKAVLKQVKALKKPCVIVMLGLASKRKTICLERFALNIRDAKIKDNRGRIYGGQIIKHSAPQALRTSAPLEEICEYLKQKRVNTEISNFGGTFVCNEIYFQTLEYFQKSRLPHLILFIHLPLPSGRFKKSKQLSSMRSAIMKAVEFTCLYLLKRKKFKATKK